MLNIDISEEISNFLWYNPIFYSINIIPAVGAYSEGGGDNDEHLFQKKRKKSKKCYEL